MITVAIVAVLAAVALPAYQNYVIRAKISEGLRLAGSAKASVWDNVSDGADSLGSGYFEPSSTDSVDSVEITNTIGLIIITYTAEVGGGTIELKPTAGVSGNVNLAINSPPENRISWDCSGGSVLQIYRSTGCRN